METRESGLVLPPLPYVTLEVIGESLVSVDEDIENPIKDGNQHLYEYFAYWDNIGGLLLIGAGLFYKPLSIAAERGSIKLPVVERKTIEDAEGDPFWTEITNNMVLAVGSPDEIVTIQKQLEPLLARWRPENPHLIQQMENFLLNLEQSSLEAFDRILVVVGGLMTYDYLRRQSEKGSGK